MMRVLHVNSGNLYGGIETLLVTLARERGLCQDLEPRFALFFEGKLARELRATGVSVSLLGPARVRYPWTILAVRRRLAALLEAERPDVVVTHGAWSHAIAAPTVRNSGVMLAHWVHAPPTGGHWLERWARRTPPDVAIANSRFTAASLDRLFPRAYTAVVYAPVSAPSRAMSQGREALRASLETAGDGVVIVIACRLERWKGHLLLIEALGRLRDDPRWIAWIAGGPQRRHEQVYLDEIRVAAARAGILPRLRFLGQRTDVPDVLAAADIHCQPNEGAEPFGLAFVEALYAGLPVITTAIGAAPEIVDTSCGVLVPVDAKALATALKRLVAARAERVRLGTSGPARAHALCAPAARLAELRDELARGRALSRASKP
jgi:glycosyltransferase involved in cell wall biosynthesis